MPLVPPAVKANLLLPIIPCIAWPGIDVSDSHDVLSLEDLPTLKADVYPAKPRLLPKRVRLADPDAARLLCLPVLSDGLSAD